MKQLTLFLSMLLVLSVNAQVTVTPSASSICPGEIVTFSVTPNDTLGTYTYLWSPMLPDTNVVQVAPPITNSWTVTVLIDSSGVFVGNGSVTVTVNPFPTTTASNTGPYCDGSTISLSASGGVQYYWTGPGGWTDTGASPTRPATLSNAGMYYVTVTDANGCQATDSTAVVVNSNPTPLISASADSVCVGSPVTLFAGGGVSYNWSTGDIGATISDTPGFTTSYGVTVTDGNGCSASTSETVTVVSNPVIIGTGGSDVSCWGGSDGTVSAGVTLPSLPVSYLWNTGDTTSSITGLITGTYTVTVTNDFGCVDTDSVFVDQPSAPLQVDSLVITDASCNGVNDGSIGVNGSGGTGFYSYDWNDGGVGNPRVNLPAGTYSVTVTDGNGCTTTATSTVWEPAPLVANTNSSSVSCFGDNDGLAVVATVGGTSPYSYGWSTGATGDTLNNLFPGVYIVNVTDGNGCQTGDTVTVNEPTQLNLSFTPTSVSCNGGSNGSIDLDVVGGTTPYSYSWSNGFLGEDPSGLIAGIYTVTVTDANGCQAIDSVSVGQPAVLSLSTTSSPATCVSLGSATVSVSGGVTPYSYNWNTGETTAMTTAPAGTYSVIVTDANNCTASAVQTVGITTPVMVSGTPSSVSCFGGNDGSITTSVVGTGPFTYLWSTGDTTANISGLSIGNYSVTVTDGNGCTTSASWSISQPAPLLTAVVGFNPSCASSNDGSVVSSTAGGTMPYSYNWSTGATSTNINSLGGGTYILTVTDANGCTATDTAVLVAPTPLTFTGTTSNISCFGGNNGSIDLTVNGGTTPYSYSWSHGFTGQDPSGLVAGTYSVTITDANGCSVTSPSWSVTQPSAPMFVTVSTIQPITCNGDTDGSLQANVSSGTGPYTWAWVGGGNTQTLSSLGAGTYQVTVTDANGCSNTASSTLTDPPVLTVDAGNTWSFCSNSGEFFEATATGGAPYTGGGYTWLWSDEINTSFHLAPASAGSYNYSVTVTDQNGCTATDNTVVNVSTEEAPFAGINLSQTGPAEWVFSSASTEPGWNYSWDFGDGYQSTLPSVSHEYVNTGAYLVTLTVTNSCGSSTAQWTINVTMTTSISEVSDQSVRVYPNPVNQYSSISVDGLNGEEVNVDVYDMTGRSVYSDISRENIIRISAEWPAGVYHLQLRQGSQTLTKKLVVQ